MQGMPVIFTFYARDESEKREESSSGWKNHRHGPHHPQLLVAAGPVGHRKTARRRCHQRAVSTRRGVPDGYCRASLASFNSARNAASSSAANTAMSFLAKRLAPDGPVAS